MYASVTSATVQPGKMDEFLKIYQESVKPTVMGFSGIKNLYVLTNAETENGITIAVYETEAEAERSQNSGDYQKVIGMVASTLILESLKREGYEVSIAG